MENRFKVILGSPAASLYSGIIFICGEILTGHQTLDAGSHIRTLNKFQHGFVKYV